MDLTFAFIYDGIKCNDFSNAILSLIGGFGGYAISQAYLLCILECTNSV